VPARMGGFMMGTYFVVIGISQYLGSVVANYAHIPKDLTDPIASLTIYTSLFNKLGFAGIGCTIIALAMLPLLRKLSSSHSDSTAPPVPLPSVVGGESAAVS
jgi:proton-dependent oligopeptide transporter, POT family